MVAVRYIATCQDREEKIENQKEMDFSFNIDNYMWIFAKLVFTLYLSLLLFKLRKNEKMTLRTLSLLSGILAITIINDIVSLTPLIAKKTMEFRNHPILNICMCLADLSLLPVMTWTMLELRKIEMCALIDMGVFKDLDEMNDREMF